MNQWKSLDTAQCVAKWSWRPSPLMSRPACQPVLCLAVRPVCCQLSLDQRNDPAISNGVENFLGTISYRVSAGESITALAKTLTSVSLSISASVSVSVSDTVSSSALAYTSSTFSPSVSAFASDRVSATESTTASASRSISLTECVRLRLY